MMAGQHITLAMKWKLKISILVIKSTPLDFISSARGKKQRTTMNKAKAPSGVQLGGADRKPNEIGLRIDYSTFGGEIKEEMRNLWTD